VIIGQRCHMLQTSRNRSAVQLEFCAYISFYFSRRRSQSEGQSALVGLFVYLITMISTRTRCVFEMSRLLF